MSNTHETVLFNRDVDLWREWLRDRPTQSGFSKFQAFMDLLFRYGEYLDDPGPYRTPHEEGGRYEISVDYLMSQWGWKNRRNVYRFMDQLQDAGFIKYERQRITRYGTALKIEVLENDNYFKFE